MHLQFMPLVATPADSWSVFSVPVSLPLLITAWARAFSGRVEHLHDGTSTMVHDGTVAVDTLVGMVDAVSAPVICNQHHTR